MVFSNGTKAFIWLSLLGHASSGHLPRSLKTQLGEGLKSLLYLGHPPSALHDINGSETIPRVLVLLKVCGIENLHPSSVRCGYPPHTLVIFQRILGSIYPPPNEYTISSKAKSFEQVQPILNG
jgi:hypothetical protein